jgi:hypothetical protein
MAMFAIAACGPGSGAEHLSNHVASTASATRAYLGGSSGNDFWLAAGTKDGPTSFIHVSGAAQVPLPMPAGLPAATTNSAGFGGVWFCWGTPAYLARMDATGSLQDLTSQLPTGASGVNVFASPATTWVLSYVSGSPDANIQRWNGTSLETLPAFPVGANAQTFYSVRDDLAFVAVGSTLYRFDGQAWQMLAGTPPQHTAIDLGAAGDWAVSATGAVQQGGTARNPWDLARWDATQYSEVMVNPPASWDGESAASYQGRAVANIGGKPGLISWRTEVEVGSPTSTASLVYNLLDGTTLGPTETFQAYATCDLGCPVGDVAASLPDGTIVVTVPPPNGAPAEDRGSLYWGTP